ncbi:hypothetical protein E3E36_09015 [Thermococcus sp. M36]|uniref:hypothetical protein n=1 Tax=Thermococcus sp. M36 TaxID=1638261 RepID=UPI00143B284C|nr:hypothetical protein [Thermococcus sp. M36]NJE06279.1 hypothetical protein [Thermococcus sp. M36]
MIEVSFAKSLLAGFSPFLASSLLITKIQGSESAKAGYHQWRVEVWENGKLEASRSGSVYITSSNESDPSDPCSKGEYWTAWLEVSPTEMVGEGKVHVKVMASYCNALPDVGGNRIDLLYLEESVYLDSKEVHSFDTSDNGNVLASWGD